MGTGAGTALAMEGIQASTARLNALFLEEAALETGSGAGAGVDVLQRRYELRLERMAVAKRLEAQVAAVKAGDAAEALDIQHAMIPPEAPVHERTYAEMSAVEEIAGVLTISSGSAGAFVHQSRQLCSLPPAMDALAAGAMSWQHARIIADETEDLGAAAATALVAHFLDPAAPNPARGATPGELVPSRFRAKVRTWRGRHHPESLEKRHARSAADRRIEYCPDRDGMAWISAYLPADAASAIWNRTNAIARGKQGPEEPRTLPQLRADEFTSALLRRGIQPGRVPAPRADVLVTVPVFSLLGLTEEPGMLDGHGPVPASMARKLATDGAKSFYRVLIDPRDGAPLEIGRKSYRLPEAVKRWLRMRDGRCTFPGCSNHTPDNETDPLLAWQHGGSTGISNLGQTCPKHHRVKHASAWTPTPAAKNEPPGWTSPTGRHYKSEHADWEPPQWPAGLADRHSEPDVLRVDHLCGLDPPEGLEPPGDLGVPGWVELPEDLKREPPGNLGVPGWVEVPEDLKLEPPGDSGVPGWVELPEDLDVPEDPGVPENALPWDPFPGWHQWLTFEASKA